MRRHANSALLRKDLMLSVLENREYFKDVFISQRQCDIVNFVVSKFKCFSVDVANKFDISVQSSSTQMKRLYEIGYLDRKEVCSDSGGIEYEYTCAIKGGFVNTLSNATAIKRAS